MSTAFGALLRTATPLYSRLSSSSSFRSCFSQIHTTPRSYNIFPLTTASRARLLHTTSPRAQYYGYNPPPTSLLSRLFYRHDGTPRSKWKGLAIAGVTTCTIFLWVTALSIVQETQTDFNTLKSLVYLQHAIYKLAFVDQEDTITLLACVRGLCSAYRFDENVDMDVIFDGITDYIQRHEQEISQYKRPFAEMQEVTEQELDSLSDPVKVKVLLAVFLSATLAEVMQLGNEDAEAPAVVVERIATQLQNLLQALIGVAITDSPEGLEAGAIDGPGKLGTKDSNAKGGGYEVVG